MKKDANRSLFSKEQPDGYNSTLFTSELLYDVPNHFIALLTVAYGAVSLSAIIGNGIVLWYVVRSKKLRTVTNLFIANLAIADILIGALAIPFQFQAALLQKWVLPHFMCAFCPFIQIISVNVSIFTLTAIAADRYLVVIHPLNRRITKDKAKLLIVIIWTVAILAAIPAAVALRVTMIPAFDTIVDQQLIQMIINSTSLYGNFSFPMKPFCDNVAIEKNLWISYNLSLVVIQYFLPLAIITFAYGKMGLKLREGNRNPAIRVHYASNAGSFRREESFGDTTLPKSNTKGQVDFSNPHAEYIVVNKKKVLKMLFIVVALFALCWAPLQTYNLLKDVVPNINAYHYINVIWFCCHWLAMSNSSVNPFIYAIYTLRN